MEVKKDKEEKQDIVYKGLYKALRVLWPELVLEDWQRAPLVDIMQFMMGNKPTKRVMLSIVGAHGTGKTTIMAMAIILSVYCLGKLKKLDFSGKVFSGKFDQLKHTLWFEVKLWINRSTCPEIFDIRPTTISMKGGICRIMADSWSSRDIHKIAGLHSENVLIFIDEASTVQDEVFHKLMGATTGPNVLFMMTSNPDRSLGYVFDVYFHNSPPYWKKYKVSFMDLTSTFQQSYVDATKLEFGEDSDDYRVKVLGEFPTAEGSAFIPRADLITARSRPHRGMHNRVHYKMGVDVASGESADYSSISIICDNELAYVSRRKVSIVDCIYWVSEVARNHGITTFSIDEIGVGCGVYHSLRDNFTVIPVNGTSMPFDKSRFYNLRAELYDKLRNWIRFCGAIPNGKEYDELIEELAELSHDYKDSRRIMVPKKGMKKSPDLADSLAYAFAVPDYNDRRASASSIKRLSNF